MFKNIVTVCTGNICRSPYAEYAFRRRLPSLEIHSAGLSALIDKGADTTGISVASTRGIDLSRHVAKQLRSATVAGADLLLVMDDSHLEQLLRRYPEARGKTFKLGKWLDDKNIVDPYKRPANYFELVFDEIDKAIDSWLPHLDNTH